jgi:competence ComEA-like helix-hairpin-helix protein
MIFTPEERRALLAVLGLLLLGEGVSLWEQHRQALPDRELSSWLTRLARARGDSMPALPDSASALQVSSMSLGLAIPPPRFPGAAGVADSQPESADGSGTRAPARLEPLSAAPPGVLETGRLRINEASRSDLEGLPGIGPALAQRILDERSRSGPFRRPEDLLRVRGIGPKKLKELAARVDWGGGTRPP